MPATEVTIYQEGNGKAPLVEWINGLPRKVRRKCHARISALGESGNELRDPICRYLDDGIWELRFKKGKVNYRILYAFYGQNAVLLTHGITKEDEVPKNEIERAKRYLTNYRNDSKLHTYPGEP